MGSLVHSSLNQAGSGSVLKLSLLEAEKYQGSVADAVTLREAVRKGSLA